MRRHLARSDFSLSELKTAARGISVFISLPQTLMATHARWLRMMTALTMREMQSSLAQPACGHPVLMVLNEFAGLRRMKCIEDGVAQISGYGVKMVFVTQTLAQIKEVYKDNWETFIANCGTKLFFCNDDHFTRDYVSKLIGDHEVIRDTTSRSQTKGASHSSSRSFTSGVSVNSGTSYASSSSWGPQGYSSGSSMTRSSGTTYSESSTFGQTNSRSESRTQGVAETVHKRSLLTPDEVGRVFGDRDRPMALALISGLQPLALHRVPYFESRCLAGFYDPHTAYRYPLTLTEWEQIKLWEAAQRRAEEEEHAREEARRMAAEQARQKDRLERENRQMIEKMNREFKREHALDCKAMALARRKLMMACVASGVAMAMTFAHAGVLLIGVPLVGWSIRRAVVHRRWRNYMRLIYGSMPVAR